MFDITGTLKKLFDEQTFGSGFTKREFVITTEADRYPQDIKFETVKEKIAQLSGLKAGDKVKVFFDLRGREWKESYFVNLNAWKIEALGADGGTSAPDSDGPPLREPDGAVDSVDEEPPF
jgi:single-strand DNA-binding protein